MGLLIADARRLEPGGRLAKRRHFADDDQGGDGEARVVTPRPGLA